MQDTNLEIAEASFRRSARPAFFRMFYERLLAADPRIPSKFAHTDFERQGKFLEHALPLLIDYAKRRDPVVIERIAIRHTRYGVNVSPKLYPHFLNALEQALAAHDPEYRPEVGKAWRAALAPGLEYMGSKYREAGEIRLKTLAIMVVIALVVTATALWQQYSVVIDRTGIQLGELARAQARLIESVAKYDAVYAGPEGGGRQRTLSQIQEAYYRLRGFGRTGELGLAEARDTMIHFILRQPGLGFRVPDPVPLRGERATYLAEGLAGNSGLVQSLDYRGHQVLAAYEYIPFLGMVASAKVDMAEIRAPFIRAALITTLVAMVAIGLGIVVHGRAVGPLLAQVFKANVEFEKGLRTAGTLSERYATVFRSAADPILIQDLKGRIDEVNQAAAEACGWPAEELVGKPLTTLAPPERRAALEALLAQCARGEDVRDAESVWVTRGGEQRSVLLTLSPLKDDHGQPVAVSTMVKDITELQRARQQLETHSHELEEKVRERTEALERELRVARALADEARREHEIALIGDSIPVRALREQIERYARTSDAVLLGGPPGSGQEAAARAIHERSARATGPFIRIDCSRPIGEDTTPLLGITRDPGRGRVAIADGGTLFLDLVSMLSKEIQEALAGLMESGAAERAGGEKPAQDVRFIAYLPADPHAAVAAGELHPALANALSMRRLVVASLSERRDDIEPLALRLLQNRARALGKPATGFAPRAMRTLQDYSWPGNIRELQNVVERAVLMSVGAEVEIEDDLRTHTRSVGGYRLKRSLGRGGMGEVFLAEHALLKRPAAVKLTQARADGSPEELANFERRFRREAEVTAQLRSPHTVELYDFGVTEDGQFYYVMEYLEGLDLNGLIVRYGAVPPERATRLIHQACLSLGEAHDAGLVHRDIKPENLFVCRMGHDLDFLKVLDFGIVKQTKSDSTSNTETGMVIGTPAYIAPEVASGDAPTARSDIYALGCVLYRLVTGRMVFDESSAMAMLVAHVEREPDRPSAVAPQPIPAELEDVILSCLMKDPAQRPQSVTELRARLDAVPVAEPWTEARAASWWSVHRSAAGTRDSSQDLSTLLGRRR